MQVRVWMARMLPLTAALCLTITGCASAGSGGSRGDPDVITLEELDEEPARDLLATVRSLRPRWLRIRASRTFMGEAPIAVIIDGRRDNEGVGALYKLRASQAAELRFMDAADATTRYGTDMTAGAIIVTLRR